MIPKGPFLNNYNCKSKFPLAPMGFLPGLRTLDPPLRPPSKQADWVQLSEIHQKIAHMLE